METTTLKKSSVEKSLALPKIGFVGMGWIGKNRYESIISNELGICGGVYDPYMPKNEAYEEVHAHQVDSFQDLIQDESIDGIVIATPNALHKEQCQGALNAGKAVFCQKPLARTATEVRELVNTAAINNKLLGVDYSYRYTDGIQKIKALLDERRLGKIFAIETAFHNAYGPDKPWFYDMERSGGGCLLDLGCHLVDLSLYLLKFPEANVNKKARFNKGIPLKKDQNQVEDYCMAGIHTETGVDINIACSWNLSAGKDAEIYFKIYGTDGSAILENVDGSFYDFKTTYCQGTNCEVISSPPEDWGGKAINAWARQLQKDGSFDENAWEYLISAEIIDKVYGR